MERLGVNDQTRCVPSPFALTNAAARGMQQQGEQVAQYKVYCIDSSGRIVTAADGLEAENDEVAAEIVRQRHGGYTCELWQGTRLVARMDLRLEG